MSFFLYWGGGCLGGGCSLFALCCNEPNDVKKKSEVGVQTVFCLPSSF